MTQRPAIVWLPLPVCAIAIALVSACASAPKPIKPPPVKPFAADPPPGKLGVICASGELGGCDTLEALKQKSAAYRALHEEQMAELKKQLVEIAKLLSLPESEPLASIEADEPNTAMWTDPEGVYPATMTVRFEYSRGLDRLGVGVASQLTKALQQLAETSDQVQRDWNALVSESRTEVPADIAAERTPATLVATLSDQSFTMRVPMSLGARYLKREALPWAAVASHVVTEGKLKHRLVQAHNIAVIPALSVSRKVGAQGLTRITEVGKRLRQELTSQILWATSARSSAPSSASSLRPSAQDES